MQLDVQERTRTLDVQWDGFVAATERGAYQQTSMWARVKSLVGWDADRLVVQCQGRIVGGCQLLIRPLPLLGVVAYAPRGPVVAGDGVVADLLLSAMRDHACRRRIRYLALQPPHGDHELASALSGRGFVESDLEIAPRATVRIDLRQPEEALLGAMHENARRNIRKAQRLKVTVREGGHDHFPAFGELLTQTARRQGFSLYPLRYYEEMWRTFAANGDARLLMAEVEEVALAMSLLIGVGDTVVYKMGAWSGTNRGVPPNELLHWAGIRWAREHGYRWYDFDDITLPAATAILAGEEPSAVASTLSRFKLRFGGEVVLLPTTHDRFYPAAFRNVFRLVAPYAVRLRPAAVRLLRHGGGGNAASQEAGAAIRCDAGPVKLS